MDWASRFGSLNVAVMSMVIGVLITLLVVVVALICIAPWLHHRNAKEPQNASEWDEELPGGFRMFSNGEAGRSNEPIAASYALLGEKGQFSSNWVITPNPPHPATRKFP